MIATTPDATAGAHIAAIALATPMTPASFRSMIVMQELKINVTFAVPKMQHVTQCRKRPLFSLRASATEFAILIEGTKSLIA
ncbi:MAG: hypothetical protein IJO87_04195 [Eggerthellaceae bacterium]|nr:hypothetical protein [Eggerthellaceae bacterium]